MNPPHDYPDFTLSTDLPPDLARLDRSLAEMASRSRRAVPVGLSDRIFEASASSLPKPLRFRDGAMVTTRARYRFHRPVWGQLAMAASIGLAFVLVAWFLAVPSALHDHSGLIAELDEQRPAVVRVAHHRPEALSFEVEWELVERSFNGGFGYLVETRDLTLADLRGDFAMLFEDLEL